ncbi:MAG: tRNA pseudouridine(38-40) synthase TruA [Oscillospiraceae bacterium]|nr:tRNA pseudouridine(38-40) synthase TruA [Oscillospiraceae bacterium]
MNIKLYLQFDGTDYCGWQIQSGRPTIQGELKDALLSITGETIMPEGCGRTDSGVHAKRYVCSFKTESNIPIERFPYALNSKLPDGIICIGAEYADAAFRANRSAVGKTYRYTIDNGAFADMFMRRYAWHYKFPIDIGLMRKAAEAFCGTHDFIGFAASGFSVKTTVRTIHSIRIEKHDSIITIDVTGSGFLYNMVRIIAGTLVYAGSGRIPAEEMPAIIASKCRERAGITAPAKGLCLEEVYY